MTPDGPLGRHEGQRYASRGAPGSPMRRHELEVLAGGGDGGDARPGLYGALLDAALGSMMLKATELYRRGRQDMLPSRVRGGATTMGVLTPPEREALLILEEQIKSLVASGLVKPPAEGWAQTEEAYWGQGQPGQEEEGRAPPSITTPEELNAKHPEWDEYGLGKLVKVLELLPRDVREQADKVATAAGRRGKLTLHSVHSAVREWCQGFEGDGPSRTGSAALAGGRSERGQQGRGGGRPEEGRMETLGRKVLEAAEAYGSPRWEEHRRQTPEPSHLSRDLNPSPQNANPQTPRSRL